MSSSSSSSSLSQRERLEATLRHYLASVLREEGETDRQPELEICFFASRGRPLRRANYDSVVARLRGYGMRSENLRGSHSLRIFPLGVGGGGGGDEIGARWEIAGMDLIERYCESDDLAQVMAKVKQQNEHLCGDGKEETDRNLDRVQFTSKTRPGGAVDSVLMFDDFGYKFLYKMERVVRAGSESAAFDKELSRIGGGGEAKKRFRYMNRVRFTHASFPVHIDLSIVKSSSSSGGGGGGGGGGHRSIAESNVLLNEESFEIEIELDNARVLRELMLEGAQAKGGGGGGGGGEAVVEAYMASLTQKLRSCVQLVLRGVQSSEFPISLAKEREVKEQYRKLMFPHIPAAKRDLMDGNPRLCCIGPSSVTLQHQHIQRPRETTTTTTTTTTTLLPPNVFREAFCVTEKADGERRLLFVHADQGLYTFDSVMNVFFMGCFCTKKEFANTLLDGEFVERVDDAKALFLAFDVYCKSGEWTFHLPFVDPEPRSRTREASRLMMLQHIASSLSSRASKSPPPKTTKNKDDVDVDDDDDDDDDDDEKGKTSFFARNRERVDHFDVVCKEFHYATDANAEAGGVFAAVHAVLNERSYAYAIDGVVLTPLHFGVGELERVKRRNGAVVSAGADAGAGIFKRRWIWSLKWKPPDENTIDFLVEILDAAPHVDADAGQLRPYRTLMLMCGFDEAKHGMHDPFAAMLSCVEGRAPGRRARARGEYRPVYFAPDFPADRTACYCNVAAELDSDVIRTERTKEIIETRSVVEFRYDLSRRGYWRWVPVRVRRDKTREYRMGLRSFGNDLQVARSIWTSIHDPVTREMICGAAPAGAADFSAREEGAMHNTDVYYHRRDTALDLENTRALRDFHNLCVKKLLIACACAWRRDHRSATIDDAKLTLVDFGVGKAGDLAKWMRADLDFVLGLDICKDNLLNPFDGACARYVSAMQRDRVVVASTASTASTVSTVCTPAAAFLRADVRENVRDLSAFLGGAEEKKLAESIFDARAFETTTPRVDRLRGIGAAGFDVSSVQFAIHYMMQSPSTLHGFMRNLCECTKLDGLVIGSCLDGHKVFRLLQQKKRGGVLRWHLRDKLVCELRRKFDPDVRWNNDWTSLGLTIEVYIDSINNRVQEFLVNLAFLEKVMFAYGFAKLRSSELEAMQFPATASRGSFEEVFNHLLRTGAGSEHFGSAFLMSDVEKELSFLNQFFLFRKVRHVTCGKTPLFACRADDAATSGSGSGSSSGSSSNNGGGRAKLKKVGKLRLAPDAYAPLSLHGSHKKP